jgi:tripartite-type tricarboxylate transporter receptor subunit TctC
MFRTHFAAVAAVAILTAAPALAQGKPWPQEKPIRWLVGVPPAGSTDPLTRAIAEQLSRRLGQSIVVENKTGGNQSIAARDVASAPADGYTLLSMGGPQVYVDKTVPVIGAGLDPVIRMVMQPMIVAGTTSRPTADLKAVLAAAKEKPGEWSFASAGQGSSHHVAGELMNSMAGTSITHVPYRGGGQAIQDAAGGQVPLIVIGVGPVLPHIHSGRMRGYALTTATRLNSLPDVPTMAELGFAGYDLAQWHGVAIKAGTPKEITERLNKEMREILATPELLQLAARLGAVPAAGTTEEWGEFYKNDIAKWDALMKRLKIDVE